MKKDWVFILIIVLSSIFFILTVIGCYEEYKEDDKVTWMFTHVSVDAITNEQGTFFVIERPAIRIFCKTLKAQAGTLMVNFNPPYDAKHFYTVWVEADADKAIISKDLFVDNCVVSEN